MEKLFGLCLRGDFSFRACAVSVCRVCVDVVSGVCVC